MIRDLREAKKTTERNPRSISFQTWKNITSIHRKKKSADEVHWSDSHWSWSWSGQLKMWRFYHGFFPQVSERRKRRYFYIGVRSFVSEIKVKCVLPLIGHILRSSKPQFRLKDGTSEIFSNHEKPIKGQIKPPRHKKKGLPDGISAIAVSSSLRGDALQSFGVRLHVTLACLSRSIQ